MRTVITTALAVEVAGRGLTVYRIGRIEQKRQRWMWNEVGDRRIGVALRWGGWAWSLRWGRA